MSLGTLEVSDIAIAFTEFSFLQVPCLIVAFLVCWLPYHLFHLLQIKGVSLSSDGACHVIRDVTFCLAFFNSALNPILNSFFLYNFKVSDSKISLEYDFRPLSRV